MAFNYPGTFALADSASIDAFGRLRVSSPVATMLDVKMNAGIQTTRWIQTTASGGTIAPVYGCAATVSCTAAAGSSAILQTKQRGIYQAGRSLMPLMTFNMGVAGVGTANIRKRVGMFDEENGLFIEQNGVDVRFVLRTYTSGAVSDANAVVKANWNIDKFDGTGPSALTIDFSKTQIMVADLEWLGVGRVRVGFVIDGLILYAHEFLNANVLTVPYMANPNLPCRYECVQTAAANTGVLLAICSTILSEGGQDRLGRLGSAATPVAGRANLGAVRDELIAIRVGPNYTRKGFVLPEIISVLQTTRAFFWELIINSSTTPTTPGTWVDVADSLVQYNVTRADAAGFAGGVIIASGFVSTAADAITESLASALAVGQLALAAAGAGPSSDILSIVVQTDNATDQTYFGSLSWRELQ